MLYKKKNKNLKTKSVTVYNRRNKVKVEMVINIIFIQIWIVN